MLLGHDPVSYFKRNLPVRGDPAIRADHDGVTYYFSSTANRDDFRADPVRYVPQYGGFCSSGAAFGLKLGSDPTEFVIRDNRLFIFGDIAGKSAWLIDPEWNIQHADEMWPEAAPVGWRWQTLKRYANKVPWYKDTAAIHRDYAAKFPGKPWPKYNPGGMVTNLFLKKPGWRAREGFGGQPVVGFVGVDPCPPACPGEVSPAFDGP
jgi:YHS domain-containing protein